MKALAYAIFVISVLLVSGFARADLMAPFVQQASYQSPVHITDVFLDKLKMELKVEGYLPTPCHAQPSASLTEDNQRPHTLVLRLNSSLPLKACVQVIQPYETAVNLAALVQASQLPIDRGTVYVIKMQGSDFEMQAAGYDLLP